MTWFSPQTRKKIKYDVETNSYHELDRDVGHNACHCFSPWMVESVAGLLLDNRTLLVEGVYFGNGNERVQEYGEEERSTCHTRVSHGSQHSQQPPSSLPLEKKDPVVFGEP